MTEPGAFSGLTVYDATQGVAGPHCTMLLTLHGAEVIKVEPPEGDWLRHVGIKHGDHSSHSLAYNRGKRSIALDLRSNEGRAAAKRLAAKADIVIENFRPGTMAKLGLDYESLAAKKPELVYCSISGYGQNGPYSGDAAIDSVIQAFSGWMHVNRDKNGEPKLLDIVVIDILAGLYAFNAVSALLLKRFRFGKGGYVDVNLLQTAVAFLGSKLIDHGSPRKDTPVLWSPPNGCFRCADGVFVVSVTRQDHFVAVCKALGRDDIAADPRFASRNQRIANGAALLAALEPELAQRTGRELHERFRAAGALGAAVQDFAALLADAHVQAQNLVPSLDLPGFGKILTVDIPGTPHPTLDPQRALPPRLGEHTQSILREHGFSAVEIQALSKGGTIKGATA
jgi:crotonobetainyl-CoA:carnitine CoA-transferase CaiB-like acyl-CoA transferase